MMVFFLWLFLVLIVYTYVGYPLTLFMWSKFKNRPVVKKDIEPGVSVIIAAWNEEDVIYQRVENLLQLDYPHEKIEILIGSDGSEDKTEEIIRSFNNPRIKLMPFTQRRGKVSVLNDVVAHASHEILVFADCRQTFAKDAIRRLVRNFSDIDVGCVGGELLFSDVREGTGKGINLYWKYEKFMRSCESDIHSTIGATGAIYAIRRELFKAIPVDVVLDDMYTPLSIIRQGLRVLYDASARAYDKVAENPKEEAARKARTLYGNYQIYGLFADLFLPWKSPVAVQFFSHKVLRVLAPFFLILVFLFNVSLADQSGIYALLLWAQSIFYITAFVGAVFRDQVSGPGAMIKNICFIPYVFCLLNFSALLGFIRFILKHQDITWEKARDF